MLMLTFLRRFFRKMQELRSVEARLQALESKLAAMTSLQNTLREGLDALRSNHEISEQLIGEFREWKKGNPPPKEPLVSVCVATFNRAPLLLSRCLPSILKQTYGNIEVIVVGDACTDATAELIREIPDRRLRFLNLPQRGQYPTDPNLRWMVAGTQSVNAALALAAGDFITHLDDDDEYPSDRIEKLLECSLEQDGDFVYHPFWYETASGDWQLNHAAEFAAGSVTTSSVFYRSWFKCIPWDILAYRLREPGDWNRFRKIKYCCPTVLRYPEPLLKHYKERNQAKSCHLVP